MRYAGDEPVPLGDALAAVSEQLGLGSTDALLTLERHWPAVVGDDVARHARVESVRDGTITITVDGTVWATQLRYLEAVIVERACRHLGDDVVSRVRVRVAPTPPRDDTSA